jgi:hypothetical protein
MSVATREYVEYLGLIYQEARLWESKVGPAGTLNTLQLQLSKPDAQCTRSSRMSSEVPTGHEAKGRARSLVLILGLDLDLDVGMVQDPDLQDRD